MPRLKQINPGFALFSGSIWVTGFNASGASNNVTTPLTTALSTAGRKGVGVPLQVSTDEDAIGIIAAGETNEVEIYSNASKEKLKDANGAEVYGRLTESSGTYTLTYYSLSAAGAETAYTFASSTAINFGFNYRYDAARTPADFAIAATAKNISQDPSNRSGAVFAERLTVTATNTLSNLSKTPISAVSVQLVIENASYSSLGGSGAAFSIAGKTITWSATNAGFSIETVDRVDARYVTNE